MVFHVWVCQLCLFDFSGGYAGAGIYYVPESGETGIFSYNLLHVGRADTAGSKTSGRTAVSGRIAGAGGMYPSLHIPHNGFGSYIGDKELSGTGICVYEKKSCYDGRDAYMVHCVFVRYFHIFIF